MKRKTLRIRLLSVILPVTLAALLLVGLATASSVRQIVYRQDAERTLMMLEQISRMVQDRMNGYYTRVLRMNMDQRLQEQLRALRRDRNDARAMVEMNAILSRYFDYDNRVVGSVFFMDNGAAYSYKTALTQGAQAIREQEWYRDFLLSEDRFYVLGKDDLFTMHPYTSYMFALLYKPLSPYLRNGVETICVAFQDDAFKSIYKDYEIDYGGNIIIADQNGQVVGTANQNSSYDAVVGRLWSEAAFAAPQGYFERDGAFISYHQCPQIGWLIVSILDAGVIMGRISATIAWIVLFVAAVCALLEAIIYLLVKRATHPLEELTAQAAASLQDGSPISGEDMKVAECIALSSSLNEMTGRLGEMLRRVEQAEQEKARLELSALQSQISPHFMLNTLSAIRALAMEGGAGEQVDEALRSFAQLLDSCLTDPSSRHTLGDERAYLDSYLEIMRIRYHKRIEANIDIPAALMGAYILKFLIQPLVENSFIHGFSDAQAGRIDIRASTQADVLCVRVSDNGCGMSGEQIESALFSGRNEQRARFNRIGLGNIRARIGINYPQERFGMTIDSDAHGTRIELRLPLSFRPDGEAVSGRAL